MPQEKPKLLYDKSITCRLCGCLNFSNAPICDSCRNGKSTKGTNEKRSSINSNRMNPRALSSSNSTKQPQRIHNRPSPIHATSTRSDTHERLIPRSLPENYKKNKDERTKEYGRSHHDNRPHATPIPPPGSAVRTSSVQSPFYVSSRFPTHQAVRIDQERSRILSFVPSIGHKRPRPTSSNRKDEVINLISSSDEEVDEPMFGHDISGASTRRSLARTSPQSKPSVQKKNVLFTSRVWDVKEFDAADFSIPEEISVFNGENGISKVSVNNTSTSNNTNPDAARPLQSASQVGSYSETTADTANSSMPSVLWLSSSPPPVTPLITSASLVVIDIDDEEDDVELEGEEYSKGLPFQSRRFPTIDFQSYDFTTLLDGLNLARRTLVARPSVPSNNQMTSEEITIGMSSPQVSLSDGISTPISDTNRSKNTITSSVGPSVVVNVLQARKEEVSNQVSTHHRVRPVIKPKIGECSLLFMSVMRELVESDEGDVRATLMQVVDLTSLSDDELDSGDEDEGEGDVQYQDNNDSVSMNQHASTSKTWPKLLPAPLKPERPKEMCVLCEEKRWIKNLIQCSQCKNYYHKRCAKEYGDETLCWNCELNGMIDDTDVTEESREKVQEMLSTLRDDSETDDEDQESKVDADAVNATGEQSEVISLATPMQSTETKMMRRWKSFLEVSTAHLHDSYEEVTTKIRHELEHEDIRQEVYSKGFTTKEEFEAAMNQVMDEFVELQEELDRENREAAKLKAHATAQAPAEISTTLVPKIDSTTPTTIAPTIDSNTDSRTPGLLVSASLDPQVAVVN